jgi:hypothetical protein
MRALYCVQCSNALASAMRVATLSSPSIRHWYSHECTAGVPTSIGVPTRQQGVRRRNAPAELHRHRKSARFFILFSVCPAEHGLYGELFTVVNETCPLAW